MKQTLRTVYALLATGDKVIMKSTLLLVEPTSEYC